MPFDALKEGRALQEEIVAMRRDLHRIPELDLDLPQTSRYIRERMEALNIPYKVMAESGIVALIEGNPKGKTIAIRADMDALAIKEEGDHDYCSTNENMHACGHDAHMAILLGTARVLAKHRDRLPGNVKLIFQPGEERVGGAEPMIAEGCLEDPRVDAIIALHAGQIFGDVKNGKIGICYGPVMASVDRLEMKVFGKGGHAAMPHNAIDTVLIAAEIVSALQKVVSREISPNHAGVVTVAEIKGGSTHNVIPGEVWLQGTVRSTNPENREFLMERIKTISTLTAQASRGEVDVQFVKGFPVCVNDKEFTEGFRETALKVIPPEELVIIEEPSMGAEDMAYYLQKVPGTLFYLGTNNDEKDIVYPNHHARFAMDEEVFWKGAALFLQAVKDFFNLK